jgi:hypothetical protein
MNINQACFYMLDETVPEWYKVWNNPNLTGSSASMSIRAILNQLMANYGMPDAMVLFNNDTLFQSSFPPTEASKNALLSHRAVPRNPDDRTEPIFIHAHYQCRCMSPDAIWHLPNQGIQNVGSRAKQDLSRP